MDTLLAPPTKTQPRECGLSFAASRRPRPQGADLENDGNGLSSSVDAWRKRLTLDFFIRGTAQRYEIHDTQYDFKNHDRDGLPAYRVGPEPHISSREWVSRLHATLYAVTARALDHGGIYRPSDTAIAEDLLPVIMVFGPPRHAGLRASTPEETLSQQFQAIENTPPPFRFPLAYDPHRAIWEYGVVRGYARPTFAETRLPAEVDDQGRFSLRAAKAFAIRISLDDHSDIVRTLNRRLQAVGFSNLGALSELEVSARRRSSNALSEALTHVLRDAGFRGLDFGRETSPTSRTGALYLNECATRLTKRFLETGCSVLERHAPLIPNGRRLTHLHSSR